KGRDAVGAHIVALHVERDRLRETDDTHLGGSVIRLAEIADEARGRGEMDVGAALLLAEMRSRGARDIEAPHEMDLDDEVPIDGRHAMEDAVAQNAGIVDDGVDAAESVERGANDALRAGGLGDAVGIGGGSAARRADLLDDALRRTDVAAALAIGGAAQIV